MHATLGQMFRGWARIYSGTTRRKPGRIIAAALFILICGFCAYPALVWAIARVAAHDPGGRNWLIASLVHLLAMTLTLSLVYSGARNPRRSALLFPLSGAILVAILVFAIRWCITGRIEWRGTVFQQQDRPSSSAA
jgi:hypothetical protein